MFSRDCGQDATVLMLSGRDLAAEAKREEQPAEERRSRGTDERGRGHEEEDVHVAVEGDCEHDCDVVLPEVMFETSVVIDGTVLVLEAKFSC